MFQEINQTLKKKCFIKIDFRKLEPQVLKCYHVYHPCSTLLWKILYIKVFWHLFWETKYAYCPGYSIKRHEIISIFRGTGGTKAPTLWKQWAKGLSLEALIIWKHDQVNALFSRCFIQALQYSFAWLFLLPCCLFLTSPGMCEGAKVLLCIPLQQPRATPLSWLIMAFQKTEHLLCAIFTLLIPSPVRSSGGAELSWRYTVWGTKEDPETYLTTQNYGNPPSQELFPQRREIKKKKLDEKTIDSTKIKQNEIKKGCKQYRSGTSR